MKFIKNLIKFLQIVCLFVPFFIILYWIFIVINFVPGIALFQPIFDPYISYVRTFSSASTDISGKSIDMVPVVAAITVIAYYFGLVMIYKIFDVADGAMESTQEVYAKQVDKAYQAKMKADYANQLKKFDVNILTVEFQIRRTNAFYMADAESVNEKAEQIKQFIDELAINVREHGGVVKAKTKDDAKSSFIFTFREFENLVKYLAYLKSTLKTKEKEFIDNGGKIIMRAVINACEEQRYATEAHYSSQIIKVTNDNEICATEIVNSKFNVLHRRYGFTLNPKGGYQLSGKTFELYQLISSNY